MMMKVPLLVFVLLSANITVSSTHASSSSSSGSEECVDLELEVQCREWEWHGECQRNPQFMMQNCRKSCGGCRQSSTTKQIALSAEEDACKNAFHSCQEWADAGKCYGLWTSTKGSFEVNAAWLNEFCPYSCGICDIHLDDRDLELNLGLPQTAPGVETDRHLVNHLRAKVSETRKYIQTFSENPALQQACKMSHPNCARMALATDCQDHAEHELIKYGCPAACQTCQQLWDEEGDEGVSKATQFWETALQNYKSKQSKWTVGGAATTVTA